MSKTKKSAIITGVLGQDGSYLSEYLIELGYEVYGVYRRSSTNQEYKNVQSIKDHHRFHLIAGDITDPIFMTKLIKDVQAEEFFSLAAQSHVAHSFDEPIHTFRTNAEATIIQLEAIRLYSPETRYYFAATSELMGGLNCPEEGYNESSAHNPRSPYALAKETSYRAVHLYKQAYGVFGCNGILFNHSSLRRGEDFATRKITKGVAKVKLGKEEHLYMGNLEAFRDEGCSKDYIKAMHLMLQQDSPEDYVVATGTGATIEAMFRYVCDLADLKFEDIYRQDERFMRPSDVPYLRGNPEKIKGLGWEPEYDWKKLLKEMYENDLEMLKKDD